MARSFSVVRIETDAGLVGWGEASTNWGHSYPTVVATVVRDVVAHPLLGTDPTDVRGRLAQLHVLLDGYLGWEASPARWWAPSRWRAGTCSARRRACRCTGCWAQPTARCALYGTGTTMFEADAGYHATTSTTPWRTASGA